LSGRVEDDRFLAGRGRYIADLAFEGLAHLAVLRSPYPHARIGGVSLAAARALPGVLGAWSGEDIRAEGLGGIHWEDRPMRDGRHMQAEPPPVGDPSVATPQPLLAHDVARYQGEPVAIIAAETLEQALDAIEAIECDWDPADSLVGTDAALESAHVIWPQAPGNIACAVRHGDARATAEGFARAHRVFECSVRIPRIVQSPMEPRGYVGLWDAASGCFTLHASAGKPAPVARSLARDVFRIAKDRVRVLAPDIGGGFGAKNVLYPEAALVLFAARRLGRPVRWLATRSEMFVSDVQAREHRAEARLAVDAKGRFLALEVRAHSDLGGYLSPKGVIPPLILSKSLTGMYDIPAAYVEVLGVHTHSPPTGPYRGAGAPEAVAITERLVDDAARALGVEPGELRLGNVLAAFDTPRSSVLGTPYDSGDYARVIALAQELADVAGLAARRAGSAARGQLRGIGYATMVEWGGTAPADRASVRADADGTITAWLGSMSQGQSHETVYAGLVAEGLGIPPDRVRVRQGDSYDLPEAWGTGASRAMTVAGSALVGAVRRLVELGRDYAARSLEASRDDIVYDHGEYRIAGTDRRVMLASLCGEEGLRAEDTFAPAASTAPNGCHVAEVEVDPETGVVRIERYSIVQDVGRALNRTVVEGQLMGGTVQGIGEALGEAAVRDAESGQLLAGSLMDYALPRASDLPFFEIRLLEVPSPVSATGAKSCGEIGATGGFAATFNAVRDAIVRAGAGDLEMPATPQHVMRALGSARGD